MTATQSRVHAGIPTGGQFAGQIRSEDTILLVNENRAIVADHARHTFDESIAGYLYAGKLYTAAELYKAIPFLQSDNAGRVERSLDRMALEQNVDRDHETDYEDGAFPLRVWAGELTCDDLSWNPNAPEHKVMGDEFPECVSCGAAFDEFSTIDT
jgi:hypothetical protein